jgi:hypothetical protein
VKIVCIRPTAVRAPAGQAAQPDSGAELENHSMNLGRNLNLIRCWLLGAALLALPAAGQNYLYTTNGDGTLTITRYLGSGGAVIIPGIIGYLPVTAIGSGAFFQCPHLTRVTIPGNINSIGDHAFTWCTSLTNVTIGDNVDSIGDGAFQDTGLTSVAIPGGVSSISDHAFANCGRLAAVTIGDGVSSIGNNAFQNTGLAGVVIPDSVVRVGDYAFAGCAGLATVTIGSGVTGIGKVAFLNCAHLTAIIVATNNPAYGSMAGVLFNQGQTTLIQCPGGLTGNYAIPGGVTSIGQGAFVGCAGLTGVTIPGTVTSIEDYAFAACTGLTNVVIPDGVTDILRSAFKACTGLTRVTVAGSVTSILDGAFQNCTSLAGVYFQGDAPIIGSDVFAGDDHATVYYLRGTSGWGGTLGDRATRPWLQP